MSSHKKQHLNNFTNIYLLGYTTYCYIIRIFKFNYTCTLLFLTVKFKVNRLPLILVLNLLNY